MRFATASRQALLVLCVASSAAHAARQLHGEPVVGAQTDGLCKPKQVHIAVTGDPSQMRVMWSTESPECKSKVHYGAVGAGNQADLTSKEYGSVDSYSANDMCGPPAAEYDYQAPALHDVVLTGIQPGRQYAYAFSGHDEVFRFTAAPAVAPDQEVRFVMYGDMGVEWDNKKSKCPGAPEVLAAVRGEVEAGKADLVVHVGDISYADGRQAVWDAFMAAIQPVASRVPYMIGVGNHEYDYRTGKEHHHHHGRTTDPSGSEGPYDPEWGNYGNDSGGECGVTVSKRFTMPGQDQLSADAGLASRAALPSNSPFWFSHDYGSVHFTHISTEHDLTKGSDQHEWLKQDLKAVDRGRTPWLVVAMHRPMYVVKPHKSNRKVGEHLQQSLEHLFHSRGVNLVLSGHVHLYSRSCPVYKSKCKSAGHPAPTHLTIGSAGHRLSDAKKKTKQEAWLAHSEDDDYGYGRFHVHDARHLTFKWIRAKDGKVKDEVKLKNEFFEAALLGSEGLDSLNGTAYYSVRSPDESDNRGADEMDGDVDVDGDGMEHEEDGDDVDVEEDSSDDVDDEASDLSDTAPAATVLHSTSASASVLRS